MTPQFYLVGGAVRDHVLGIEAKDKDYVVVGADPDYMLAQGYKQVGADFPVFIHPDSNEEYALARTERKTGQGYHGFEVAFGKDVTLEEDLARRDLTINSMAMTENLQIIDPFNGIADLRNKVLRHTSPAFADDPLRVLRLARFAARYDFTVAPETIQLAKQLVTARELDYLTPERVWKELNRAVMEPYAHRFFEVLEETGAMQTLMMYKLFNGMNKHMMNRVLTVSHALGADANIIIGLLSNLNNLTPHELKEESLAHWLSVQRTRAIELLDDPTASNLLSFLEQAKMLQETPKWDTLQLMLTVMEHSGLVRDGVLAAVIVAHLAVKDVKADEFVGVLKGPEIGKALRNKRLAVIKRALHTMD